MIDKLFLVVSYLFMGLSIFLGIIGVYCIILICGMCRRDMTGPTHYDIAFEEHCEAMENN